MKQWKLWLAAGLLFCLCACASAPESSEPIPQEPLSAALPEEETPQEQTLGYGVCEADGKTVFVGEDGFALDAADELKNLDGKWYYFEHDHSLRLLPEGYLELGEKKFMNVCAGYFITPPAEGAYLADDTLYFVQEDGSLLVNDTNGYLQFGEDGRYTCGEEELDEKVTEMIRQARQSAGENASAEELLHACYLAFCRDYKYLSMDHYEAGSTGWELDSASVFFENGKGNCYSWASAVMLCARQLGYQAYCVAGWESNPSNDHAWTMIRLPDGSERLLDAELEFAYEFIYQKPPIDMFMVQQGEDGLYNGFSYYFPEGDVTQ